MARTVAYDRKNKRMWRKEWENRKDGKHVLHHQLIFPASKWYSLSCRHLQENAQTGKWLQWWLLVKRRKFNLRFLRWKMPTNDEIIEVFCRREKLWPEMSKAEIRRKQKLLGASRSGIKLRPSSDFGVRRSPCQLQPIHSELCKLKQN